MQLPHRMTLINATPSTHSRRDPSVRKSGVWGVASWRAWGLAAALCGPATANDAFGDKLLQLGTGPAAGAFSPIGRALCDAVNEERSKTLVRCVPVATAGSVFNLTAVAIGQLQLGIAQEDLYAAAIASKTAESAGLRSLALLHASPISVMVKANSGIQNLSQIAGKVVNLGNRGSGQFAITGALLKALKLDVKDLGGVTYATSNEFEKLFCEGKVDVVVEAVAHPSNLFEKLHACGGQFLPIPADVSAAMRASNSYLNPMVIAANTYVSQTQSIETLGMRNVLFTHSTTDAQAIARFTGVLVNKTAALRTAQALLQSMPDLTAASTLGLAAPPHAGALRALQGAQP